jgi:hypothetical protein
MNALTSDFLSLDILEPCARDRSHINAAANATYANLVIQNLGRGPDHQHSKIDAVL